MVRVIAGIFDFYISRRLGREEKFSTQEMNDGRRKKEEEWEVRGEAPLSTQTWPIA